VLAACGGKNAATPTTTAPTTTATTAPVSHAAPELEALLPAMIDGHRLAKGSASGAVVLSGNNAFSSVLTGILARANKTPADLTFANAQDPSLGVEVGAFRVLGLAAPVLGDAIVRSTRPNAPGLAVSSRVVGGRRVTRVVYGSGATLYLYPHRDVVYYVGTQDAALATRILHRLG
jgi:hypothetical protein